MEEQNPVFCRRTHFWFFVRMKSMLLKTAMWSKTDTNYQSMDSEMHTIQRTKHIPWEYQESMSPRGS